MLPTFLKDVNSVVSNRSPKCEKTKLVDSQRILIFKLDSIEVS